MANTSFQALQHKIRADALEQQSALSSLQSWQAEIKAKDASLKSITTKAALPQPRNARQSTDPASDATAAATTEQGAVSTPGKTTAADHTYDKGYKKWERFEVVSCAAGFWHAVHGNAIETRAQPVFYRMRKTAGELQV